MSLTFFLKNNFDKIPYGVGRYLANIPFHYRPGIGQNYSKASRNILHFENLEHQEKQTYLFERIKKLTEYAYSTIPFYKYHYDKHSFHPRNLRSFHDIETIPIINKNLLLEWEINKRSNSTFKNVKVNTGGSSGNPLSLLIPEEKLAIELAHSFHLRKKQLTKLKFNDLKLYMGGRSDIANAIDYDFKRNRIIADIYKPFYLISEKLQKDYGQIRIPILQGYPSAIYEFALHCQEDKVLLNKLKRDLKGIFFNSEFPQVRHRKFIENIFQTKTYAFYGHTEGCIIAYETENNNYHPLHSYGYAETATLNNKKYLVGTNYYNYSSPLIRYNTEDIVSLNENPMDRLLQSFSISEGRAGDFVLDKNDKKIPLTALIFGRHHLLFEYCTHIQVQQKKSGFVKVFYVQNGNSHIEPKKLFDTKNVEIEFDFEKIEKPIKTPAGKLKLLI